ncbi:uncharacterized protein LOC132550797 [Ylistrum balloti]|uniref:uncharacterized protein LOC132550797 n=1 Tax=Ylistrum balloti TaxID=509963 RepID=UPI0029059770|nr:uncharacterized protein LOC132550797 [Ylistrum balloti]
MHLVIILVYATSGFHVLLGLLSVCLGVISSIKSEVWLAHRVSPIWSGGFFIITGIVGVVCARRKSSYVIMCFTAFNVVSMVTAVVSIQLLRLGLVNHTTDGETIQKAVKDMLILVALGAAGTECLVCLISTVLSCRVAKIAKEEMSKQREGMFYVKEDTDTFECSNRSFDADVDEGAYTADESGISIDIEDPHYRVDMDTKGNISMATNIRTDREFDGIIYETESAYAIIKTKAEPAINFYKADLDVKTLPSANESNNCYTAEQVTETFPNSMDGNLSESSEEEDSDSDEDTEVKTSDNMPQ